MIHLRKIFHLILRDLWTGLSYRLSLTLGILSGIISLLQFALLGYFLQEGNTFPGIASYGGNILAFLITGSVFTSFVGVALSSFSGFLQSEQSMGTLEALLVSTTPLTRLMIYSGIASFINTLVNTAILLGLLLYLFGVPLSINFTGVAVSLAALLFSLLGFGLMSTGILLVSKQGDPITWTLTTLTGLVSGVLYPVSILPPWLQNISYSLPTTQALEALRLSLLQNAGLEALSTQLIALSAWGAASLPIGLIILRWGLKTARLQGSLGEF